MRNAVTGFLLTTVRFDVPRPHTWTDSTHHHDELIWATSGTVTVRTPEGVRDCPGNRGIWVPHGAPHSIAAAAADTPLQATFFAPAATGHRLQQLVAPRGVVADKWFQRVLPVEDVSQLSGPGPPAFPVPGLDGDGRGDVLELAAHGVLLGQRWWARTMAQGMRTSEPVRHAKILVVPTLIRTTSLI